MMFVFPFTPCFLPCEISELFDFGILIVEFILKYEIQLFYKLFHKAGPVNFHFNTISQSAPTDLEERLIWSVNEYFSSTGNFLLKIKISFDTSLESL